NYGMLFVLAIPLGVALGYYLDPKRKGMREARSENQVTDLANAENQSGYLKSFLAGLFLIYGARMAGGCTSGHMMSGIMQSSISGFIFAAVVFAVAIPLAMLWAKLGGKNVN
ncbi:MAG: YeeE/YedE thiosulfate transporter family protein, partial [Eubacteriales bacterium]|nr:YeeE/YedE thiosulfate transporter family protein [Eubacteriales bacterium]